MASDAIEAAKFRLALAKKWQASASQMLVVAKSQANSAQSEVVSSQEEVEKAAQYLKALEKKFQVIDVDLGEVVDVDNDSLNGAATVSSGPTSNTMQIFVKCLTGRTITLDVKPSDTIGSVKIRLAELGLDPLCISHEQNLIYGEKFLRSSCTLSDYKVSSMLAVCCTVLFSCAYGNSRYL